MAFLLAHAGRPIQLHSSSALEVKQKVWHAGQVESHRFQIMNDVLTIGEVATRSGVATSALRFYEEQGLIHAERNNSGHRRYPRAVIRRVAFIVFAQKVGLSLDEIRRELARLPRNHVPERSDWAKLSHGWNRRIEERIAELERLRAGLTECIGCGCLSLDRCQFANPGDRAARRGAGPRYWVTDHKR
jgi:MerR family redox-sensitive transcriptional activator SoxR